MSHEGSQQYRERGRNRQDDQLRACQKVDHRTLKMSKCQINALGLGETMCCLNEDTKLTK